MMPGVEYTEDRMNGIWTQQSETIYFGGGSVMVWGGITLNGRTDLHVFLDGTINAERYRDEILGQYVIPFTAQHGAEFILQQDNARPHTARVVTRYLHDYNITIMAWPANSPDLNPIEHLSDLLKRRLQSRPQAPDLQTLAEIL